MSHAQQQIINMASDLNEDDANFVANFMSRLIFVNGKSNVAAKNEKMLAFERLDRLVSEFTPVLNPDKELADARNEKYGVV